jgi:hypothetical protein
MDLDELKKKAVEAWSNEETKRMINFLERMQQELISCERHLVFIKSSGKFFIIVKDSSLSEIEEKLKTIKNTLKIGEQFSHLVLRKDERAVRIECLDSVNFKGEKDLNYF